MKFKWYKWREHTSGAISKWEYILVCNSFINKPQLVKEHLENTGLLSTWSEHFRKVEVLPAYKVPADVIVEKTKDIEELIKNRTEELKWLKGK